MTFLHLSDLAMLRIFLQNMHEDCKVERTENREQKAENREQRAENKEQRTESKN